MTMLTYECPHCGYLQEYPNAQAIVVCQACGTRSRMPDERVRERADFRNAREMQHHGDFPNAEASYLRVLDAVPDDADALWGRLLCHYGAKLVIDAGGERRYTINQPRSKPLRAQGDFERACALTLPEIRDQYEQDAAYIDAAMQRIRERAAGMPPYDIFICHKTTPLSGQGLTEDYARARDLRDLLTSQGYRVFFAPVDMAGIIAGEGYEAGIYHGLYTAKVMLVVCSTPEHLNATWVRSEWERFLTRCDEGENVALIPLLYGGMKDSQLPRAFTVRNLQAITMELGGKDTLLKRLGELIRREKPAKRDRPMLTVLLALLLIAAFATGGSYVYAQMNGLDWPQGVINAIWDREDTPKDEGSPENGNDPTATEMITPMPTTSTPAPTTATPAPTTPAPIPTTATPSPTPTATPTASPTPTAPPMPTASPEPTLVTKGKKVGDYRIDVYSNGTCVITDYTGNEAELNVPSLLDGCVVTNLGDNAFNGCSELISITLPEGLASIGYGTFSSCRNLRSITLPDSVTSIGEVAFAGCYELKSITLPKGLTSIGDGMFNECRNLRSITLPDSVTSIGDNAFFLCSELVSIMLPEGLTSIGDYAFQYCKALTSITIPSAVISIGNSAFSGCKALTSITIPSGVTSIGNSAFYGCKALTSITIPSGVTSIGTNAFCECDSLARITLPEGLTSIGPGAFWGCKSLTSITLPDSVISIGDIAFLYIPNLTLYVARNSYAAAYAQKNNIRYFYTD